MTKEDLMIKLEDWKSELIRKEKSQKTIGEYYRDVLQFIESLPKDKDIREKIITDSKEEKTVVTQYKENLKNQAGKKENTKISISSQNRKIISINAFLTFCKLEDLKIKQVKEQSKQDNFSDDNLITWNDYNKILERAEKEGNQNIYYGVMTLAKTGLRYNELRFLTVESLKDKLKNKKIYADNKGKTREIHIEASLCKILLQWAKYRGSIIFQTKNGTFISNPQFSRALKKVVGQLRYIKKDKVHPHAFRHLFAKSILDNKQFVKDKDGNVKEVTLERKLLDLADILGHSSLETTRLYCKSTSNEKQKMINSMIENNNIKSKAFDSSKVKAKTRKRKK